MTDKDAASLKTAITMRLGAVAGEHRVKHQEGYANRYRMRSDHDAPVEIMFEKGADTLAHLWVLAEQVAPLSGSGLDAKLYPKADLYTAPAKGGGMQYGRHSALEPMPMLGKADLVRFTLRSKAELDQVLSVLSQVQRKGVR